MWALFKLKDHRVMFPLHAAFALVPLYLLHTTSTSLNITLFTLGVIYANFMEWYNHKINFHLIPHLFANPRVYFVVHGHHHKYPDANPVTPLPQTLFLYLVSDFIFRVLFGASHLHVLSGGGLGFLIFELTHVFIHKVEREDWEAPWLRPMIDYHLTHHVESKTAYGFTSPFWDWVSHLFGFGDLPSEARYQWPIVPIPLPIVPFIVAKALHVLSGKEVKERRAYNPDRKRSVGGETSGKSRND